MNLYRIYSPDVVIEFIVANTMNEAREVASLLYNLYSIEEFHLYKATNIPQTPIEVDLLVKEVGAGYFDLRKPANFKYDSCTWHPFVPFTVRGYYIDLAINALEV